jgi:hypothetical protein
MPEAGSPTITRTTFEHAAFKSNWYHNSMTPFSSVA